MSFLKLTLKAAKRLIILTTLSMGLPALAHATFDFSKTRVVNCDTPWGMTISKAIALSDDGDTVKLIGDCIENIIVKKEITIDGGGEATLTPENPDVTTIRVFERNVRIEGLNIVGVSNTAHVYVDNQSTLIFKNNVISNSSTGMTVSGQSLVSIVGNHFNNLTASAIFARENSTVTVGYSSTESEFYFLPNIIENVGTGLVFMRANGEIIGNHIINNAQNGIVLVADSSIRAAGNELSGNNIGIVVTEDSHLDLALTGGIFGEPNYGTNAGLAVVCLSSYVGGTIGPDFAPVINLETCENNTTP